MPARSLFTALLLAPLLGAATALSLGFGCTSSAPSPFTPDGGDGGGHGGGGAGAGGEDGGKADPTVGGPCVDDGQCDDGIPCTFDACDHSVARCRFTPDDSACQNGRYCDGVERCDPKLGCRPGEPVGCGDDNVCTVDACDESTRTCTHAKRDADQDGDPDVHCGGGDCDDADPSVSSKQPELCANGKDDNCNGVIDEAGCIAPQHDTCADPLEIQEPGAYVLQTAGASLNYPSGCLGQAVQLWRDVVAAIVLPAGPPVDVQITARTDKAGVAVTLAGQCGDAASQIACGGPHDAPQGGKIATLRARSLGDPAKPTALPLYVATIGGAAVTLDVAFLPASTAPTNETCGTAAPITPGVPAEAQIFDAVHDLGSACATDLGELVYRFDLAAPADVDVYATSVDGDGLPAISLRTAACALPADEIACQSAAEAHVFRHELPAGTYDVAVSATAPTTALVTVDLSPPTGAPPDDSCATAPPITPNHSITADFAGHQDDIDLGCASGMVDVAYALDVPVASDVLLVERISQNDEGAIELSAPACAAPTDRLACTTGSTSPLRASKRRLAPGMYRVVAETQLGQPIQLDALTRPAVAPTLVPFSDACADALEIPPEGGFFQGNTSNARADFNAGCDQGGTPEGGAPDQLLKLTLPARKRVVLEMEGSGYTTLLDVRRGPDCPGAEVPLGCTVGTGPQQSFLDLTLDAGVYFLQIDGLAQDSGPWFLDVRVVDP